MKKLMLSLFAVLCLSTSGVHASGGGYAWDKAPNKLNDLAALQNGAKLFVNYCLNCHSAAFMRFNRLKDIGLSDKQIKDNLLFTTEKVGETMKSSIDPRQAKDWFGANPPDLTLIARSRSAAGQGTGADYLYTYLRTYYVDASKATGWNNLAFPNVGMPHVLWELQGKREPIWEDVKSFGEGHGAAKKEDAHGAEAAHILKGWKQLEPGTMTSEQYDQAMGDLVNYLQWMSEPGQNSRVRIGFWVLSFLLVMTLFAWRLNAAFWKDVK